MSTEKPFYVYVHKYASGPKTGQVFYVGKGKGRRAWAKDGRSTYWKRIVEKYGYDVSLIFTLISEDCAFSLEKALIRHYGNSNLCNITNGGEGVSGLTHTIDARKKMSGPRPHAKTWLSGKKAPDWLKEKWRYAKKGKRQSPEHAAKSRVAKIGKKIQDTSKFNLDKRKKIVNCAGEVFDGVNCAARALSERTGKNVSQGTISMVLCGVRKRAYGFHWSYV